MILISCPSRAIRGSACALNPNFPSSPCSDPVIHSYPSHLLTRLSYRGYYTQKLILALAVDPYNHWRPFCRFTLTHHGRRNQGTQREDPVKPCVGLPMLNTYVDLYCLELLADMVFFSQTSGGKKLLRHLSRSFNHSRRNTIPSCYEGIHLGIEQQTRANTSLYADLYRTLEFR